MPVLTITNCPCTHLFRWCSFWLGSSYPDYNVTQVVAFRRAANMVLVYISTEIDTKVTDEEGERKRERLVDEYLEMRRNNSVCLQHTGKRVVLCLLVFLEYQTALQMSKCWVFFPIKGLYSPCKQWSWNLQSDSFWSDWRKLAHVNTANVLHDLRLFQLVTGTLSARMWCHF